MWSTTMLALCLIAATALEMVGGNCPYIDSAIEHDNLQHVRSVREHAAGNAITAASYVVNMCVLINASSAGKAGAREAGSLLSYLKASGPHRTGHLRVSVVEDADYNANTNGVNGIFYDCDAIIQLVAGSRGKSRDDMCPRNCNPTPLVTVPIDGLLRLARGEDGGSAFNDITCSLTTAMLLDRSLAGRGGRTTNEIAARLLREIFWRRIFECQEKKIWQSIFYHHYQESKEREYVPSQVRGGGGNLTFFETSGGGGLAMRTLPPLQARPLDALVVWVGSRDKAALLQSQNRVIGMYTRARSSSSGGEGRDVVGFAATDELFPCSAGAIKCLGGGRRHLPQSAINFMPSGWSCAQRRPLRALAHVLLLYSPEVLILADDDTFVNMGLFMDRYYSSYRNDFLRAPIVLGEFQGKTGQHGHLTTSGLFAGGAGYILSRKTIELLNTREVAHGPYGQRHTSSSANADVQDEFRSKFQWMSLSVLREATEACKACPPSSRRACPESTAPGAGSVALPSPFEARQMRTIRSISHWGVQLDNSSSSSSAGGGREGATGSSSVVPIDVRLVDLCVHLMAGENTCLHSDHSVGRCLFFAARAYPIGVGCQNLAPHPSRRDAGGGDDLLLGQCFMTPVCDLTQHITCHRYAQDSGGGGPRPVRTSTNRNYYKNYSSFYNGFVTDTY